MLEILVDVAAKNGSLLLNIPQLPDGTIDDECGYLLDELARGLSVRLPHTGPVDELNCVAIQLA